MADQNLVVVNEEVPYFYAVAGEGIIAGPQGQRGPTGPRGAAGNTVLSGTANPTMAVGVTGDFYLNTTNTTLFGPKTTTSWGSGKSLIGERGPQGVPGPTGPQGPTGPAGSIANIPYGGTGQSTDVARADHNHDATYALKSHVHSVESGKAEEHLYVSSVGFGNKAVPANATLIRQAGGGSYTPGTGGVVTVPYPKPFPNGTITVIPVVGAQTAGARYCVLAGNSSNNGQFFTVVVFGANGSPISAGSTGIRINFFAVGW